MDSERVDIVDKEPTTSGLGPDKIKELFKVCSEDPQKANELTVDEEKAEQLNDFLAETLPLGSPSQRPLKDGVERLCTMSGLARSDAIRTLLKNTKTDIYLIRKIKDHYKDSSEQAVSKSELDAAKTIYFLAIAHALVHHDTLISKFSFDELRQSFSVYEKQKWILPDLKNLFERADKYCLDKLGRGK